MSRSYNTTIRAATVQYAMLEQLRKPRPEFEAVIRAHFRLRSASILTECGEWVRDGTVKAALLAELTAELGKL